MELEPEPTREKPALKPRAPAAVEDSSDLYDSSGDEMDRSSGDNDEVSSSEDEGCAAAAVLQSCAVCTLKGLASPVEFRCTPCGCAVLCKKCAMRMATGGKCKGCGQLFIGCHRLAVVAMLMLMATIPAGASVLTGGAPPPDASRNRISVVRANYEYYCSGDPQQCANSTASSAPLPSGGEGGTVLMGGGTDVGGAFQWMGKRSGGGGLLVLRTGPSGDDAYDSFILGLGGVSSAATLILLDASASVEPFVLRKIGEAASIFFAGGDQSKYWRYWQGTPVQTAVQARVDAGCPVGGTSAGEAILSSYVPPPSLHP